MGKDPGFGEALAFLSKSFVLRVKTASIFYPIAFLVAFELCKTSKYFCSPKQNAILFTKNGVQIVIRVKGYYKVGSLSQASALPPYYIVYTIVLLWVLLWKPTPALL